jgi:hypothetical protein
MKDRVSRFRVSVVWVNAVVPVSGDLMGKKFLCMEPSWIDKKNKFSFANFHSYLVSELSHEFETFSRRDLVGKGSCLIISGFCAKARNFREPREGQKWLFDLLDHCQN